MLLNKSLLVQSIMPTAPGHVSLHVIHACYLIRAFIRLCISSYVLKCDHISFLQKCDVDSIAVIQILKCHVSITITIIIIILHNIPLVAKRSFFRIILWEEWLSLCFLFLLRFILQKWSGQNALSDPVLYYTLLVYWAANEREYRMGLRTCWVTLYFALMRVGLLWNIIVHRLWCYFLSVDSMDNVKHIKIQF